jgi:FkbM family methyltransferase
MIRSTAFLVQRFVLGRQTLLARVPEFDLELRVAARDAVGRHLYRDGMHAPAVTDFLTTRLDLRAGELAFDVGASIGWYSLLLARIAPRGVAIHAFEPDPWMGGLLRENASRNRATAITVVGAAVGDAPGPVRLVRYGHPRRGRNGLLPLRRAESIEVDMVSLDEYCRRAGLSRQPVGFIRLGVEGFEVPALCGARETLGRCRTLLTDYSPARLERAGSHPAAMLDLLAELGFRPAMLVAGGVQPVSRAELLADRQPRKLCWTRPVAEAPAPPADPDVLAI